MERLARTSDESGIGSGDEPLCTHSCNWTPTVCRRQTGQIYGVHYRLFDYMDSIARVRRVWLHVVSCMHLIALVQSYAFGWTHALWFV